MPDVLIRVDLDESGATAGLDRVVGAFDKLEQHSLAGTQGVRRIEFGLATLATQATGTTGPLAKVVEGLILLGGGSTVMIGAAAGVAAIAFVMKKLGDEAATAKKENEGLLKSLASLGPTAATHAAVIGLNQQLTDLDAKRLATQQRLTGLRQQAVGDPGAFARTIESTEAHLVDLETQRAVVLNNLATATTAAAKAADARAEALGRESGAESAAFYMLDAYWKGLMQRRGEPAGAQVPIRPGPSFRVHRLGELQYAIPEPGHFAGPGPDQFLQPEDKKSFAQEFGPVIAASFAAVAAAVSGGAPGAAIAGIGGLASSIGGLKSLATHTGLVSALGIGGIALSGIGMLASLFGGGQQMHVVIDGYDARALTQQQQMLVALTGFKGLNIDILSAGGDVNSILARLGRAARTDGTIRVPPGG